MVEKSHFAEFLDREVVFKNIQKALDKINNELQLHEGAIGLVDYQNGVAYLELKGACVSCCSAGCGLLANVEDKLKSAEPKIKKIIVL